MEGEERRKSSARLKLKTAFSILLRKLPLQHEVKITRGILAEETAVFIVVLKWLVLAVVVGAVVGASTYAFVRILEASLGMTVKLGNWWLLLPFGMFLSALLTTYLSPEAKGHGTEKVIESVHKKAGDIPFHVVPVKLVATVITISSGGSVGKEGPCAQIGAGITSVFAKLLKLPEDDRKKLVICGISAGFSAVFGTPIAGAVFGVEVLYVGAILYDVLLPSFVSGMISYNTMKILGYEYFYESLNFNLTAPEGMFIKSAVAGVFFGLVALGTIKFLNFSERVSEKLRIWQPAKAFFAGVGLIFLVFITSPKFLGLGTDTIVDVLSGQPAHKFDFLLKIVFTCITLAFGGSGGVVTPLFFIGSTAGATLSEAFGHTPDLFASLGLVSVLAGAANTPISASIMYVEIFGPELAPFAALSCVISFLMTGYSSIYPSQVIAIRKIPHIHIRIGKIEIEIPEDIPKRI